jgi:nitrogen fixation protein NifB
LVSPKEALDLVRRQVRLHPGETFVVGVAGPGEPLANAETFEALELVHQQYPYLFKCLSTNGLLLEQKLPQLLKVGLRTLTVTVNAVDGVVGEQIYLWVRHKGQILRGREAVEILIASQMRGIRAALDAGLVVKANTVLIPGVNDGQVTTLAQRLQELGVHLMNIMPLIPCGQMKARRRPTPGELQSARLACAELLPQFRKCEQCSADVVRFPQLPR